MSAPKSWPVLLTQYVASGWHFIVTDAIKEILFAMQLMGKGKSRFLQRTLWIPVTSQFSHWGYEKTFCRSEHFLFFPVAFSALWLKWSFYLYCISMCTECVRKCHNGFWLMRRKTQLCAEVFPTNCRIAVTTCNCRAQMLPHLALLLHIEFYVVLNRKK